MQVKDLITSRICDNTVFEGSWIWYCDECRQHGTAISSEEADFMATAHWNYHSIELVDEDIIGALSDEEAEEYYDKHVVRYSDVSPDRLHKYDWENNVCAIYIVDEGNNITYDFGDDYEDKTPNDVTDLQTMLDLQKKLGLQ